MVVLGKVRGELIKSSNVAGLKLFYEIKTQHSEKFMVQCTLIRRPTFRPQPVKLITNMISKTSTGLTVNIIGGIKAGGF